MKKIVSTLVLGVLFAFNAFSINYVSNGDFELGTTTATSWWSAINANATFAITSTSPISGLNSAQVTVNTQGLTLGTAGINQYVSLVKGGNYTVSFKASANANCNVQSAVSQYYGSFNWVGQSLTLALVANTPRTSSYSFTAASTGLHKLNLFCGTAAAGTVVNFDDITVVENTPQLNMVNGDFETGNSNLSNALYSSYTSSICGWTIAQSATVGSTAAMTVALDSSANAISGTKSLKITSTGTPNTTPASADLQLVYPFAGVNGMYYTVSFSAKASAACTMGTYLSAVVWNSNSNFINEKTLSLTKDALTTVSYTSTPFTNVDGRALLMFRFGKLANGVSVTLDDVKVYMSTTPTAISKLIAERADVSVSGFNSQIKISTPLAAKASVYTVDGRLVKQQILVEGENQFSLSKGVYVVIVETATEIFKSTKIIL